MKITNLGPGEYRGTTDKKLEGTGGMELLIIAVGETATVRDDVGKMLIDKFGDSALHKICEAGKEPKAEPEQESEKRGPGRPPKEK